MSDAFESCVISAVAVSFKNSAIPRQKKELILIVDFSPWGAPAAESPHGFLLTLSYIFCGAPLACPRPALKDE